MHRSASEGGDFNCVFANERENVHTWDINIELLDRLCDEFFSPKTCEQSHISQFDEIMQWRTWLC